MRVLIISIRRRSLNINLKFKTRWFDQWFNGEFSFLTKYTGFMRNFILTNDFMNNFFQLYERDRLFD